MITLIPLLPLAGFVVTLLLGRGPLKRRPEVVSLAAVTGSWVLSMIVVAHVFGAHTKTIDFNLFTWVSAGSFHVQWGYLVDSLAAVMLIVVSTIGMLVHYYSIGYMRGDGGYYRFFAYLNLFMFAMFTLILANNYLLVFLGWEGVGLCSYLLISFWFHKKSASQAGKKAFLVNRVGDWGFTLGLFLMFTTFGSLQFGQVFAAVPHVSPGLITWISLLLFVGAVGKSAQFPLHVWLPDAMEGPTPVSALIHAATMVNAGVYMIARSYPLVSHSHTAMLVVMSVGTFTAIYAACIALTQNDIKKVIAYSTISSLGFMFMALGAGAWVAAIFYLFAHGFFKGLLFLGSGSVIHSMSGEQDMRRMGGLRKKLPLTFWAMLVGALANVGLFPFAGFWAKDEILGGDFAAHYYVIWAVGIVTAFVTALFMFRLMFLTFWGENRASAEVQDHIHESPRVMTVPLVILAVPAAVLGLVVGLPPDDRLAAHLPAAGVLQRREASTSPGPAPAARLMVLSLVVVVLGIYTAYVAYLRRPELPARAAARVPWAYQASLHKFYMDEVYDAAVIRPVMGFAMWLWTFVDVKVIDGAVNGLAWVWGAFGRALRPLQTGRAQSYAFGVFAGLFVLVILIRYFWGA